MSHKKQHVVLQAAFYFCRKGGFSFPGKRKYRVKFCGSCGRIKPEENSYKNRKNERNGTRPETDGKRLPFYSLYYKAHRNAYEDSEYAANQGDCSGFHQKLPLFAGSHFFLADFIRLFRRLLRVDKADCFNL